MKMQYLIILIMFISCRTNSKLYNNYIGDGISISFNKKDSTFFFYQRNELSGIGYSKGTFQIVNDTIFFKSVNFSDFLRTKLSVVESNSEIVFNFKNYDKRFSHVIEFGGKRYDVDSSFFSIPKPDKIQELKNIKLIIKFLNPHLIGHCSYSHSFLEKKIYSINDDLVCTNFEFTIDYNFFLFEKITLPLLLKGKKVCYGNSKSCLISVDSSLDFNTFNYVDKGCMYW